MRISEFLEKRKFPRALIDAEVKLSQSPSSSWQGLIYLFTTNISAGGIFIETPTPAEIGREVNISLVMPKGEILKNLVGKVVRNQDKNLNYHLGVGIEFINLGDQNRQIIQAYVNNEQEQERVIRRILSQTTVKLILPSAQYRVLTNPDLDVVLKVPMTYEEMWTYGVYDYSNAFVSNWGIDYLEGGFNLRLFDLWEIMDNEEIIRKRLSIHRDEVITYIKTSWEYYDRIHPFSLFNLTGTDIVDWFKDRILEEYTIDKFEKYWCCKIKNL